MVKLRPATSPYHGSAMAAGSTAAPIAMMRALSVEHIQISGSSKVLQPQTCGSWRHGKGYPTEPPTASSLSFLFSLDVFFAPYSLRISILRSFLLLFPPSSVIICPASVLFLLFFNVRCYTYSSSTAFFLLATSRLWCHSSYTPH